MRHLNVYTELQRTDADLGRRFGHTCGEILGKMIATKCWKSNSRYQNDNHLVLMDDISVPYPAFRVMNMTLAGIAFLMGVC